MKPRLLALSLTLLLLSLPWQARAGEMQMENNSREQCRAQVSGRYLEYMNDLDLLKGNLATTSDSALAMKAQRKIVDKDYRTSLALSERQKIPAADLDERMVGLRYQLETFDQEIRDLDARIAEIKDQIATKENAFKGFKEKAKPIFEAKASKIITQGAYPIVIEYRHPCDRFNQLCPLPDAQAKALKTLSKTLPDPIACDHYSAMQGAK